MNQLIPLNETGLHALIVQSCTGDFEITCNTMLWYNKYDIKYHDCNWPEMEVLPEGKWEIFGTIGGKENDYPGDSMAELLASKEIFWVNPMGEEFNRRVMKQAQRSRNEPIDPNESKPDFFIEYNHLQSKCLSENQKVLIINKIG